LAALAEEAAGAAVREEVARFREVLPEFSFSTGVACFLSEVAALPRGCDLLWVFADTSPVGCKGSALDLEEWLTNFKPPKPINARRRIRVGIRYVRRAGEPFR
jgi:hypothetical protein